MGFDSSELNDRGLKIETRFRMPGLVVPRGNEIDDIQMSVIAVNQSVVDRKYFSETEFFSLVELGDAILKAGWRSNEPRMLEASILEENPDLIVSSTYTHHKTGEKMEQENVDYPTYLRAFEAHREELTLAKELELSKILLRLEALVPKDQPFRDDFVAYCRIGLEEKYKSYSSTGLKLVLEDETLDEELYYRIVGENSKFFESQKLSKEINGSTGEIFSERDKRFLLDVQDGVEGLPGLLIDKVERLRGRYASTVHSSLSICNLASSFLLGLTNEERAFLEEHRPDSFLDFRFERYGFNFVFLKKGALAGFDLQVSDDEKLAVENCKTLEEFKAFVESDLSLEMFPAEILEDYLLKFIDRVAPKSFLKFVTSGGLTYYAAKAKVLHEYSISSEAEDEEAHMQEVQAVNEARLDGMGEYLA